MHSLARVVPVMNTIPKGKPMLRTKIVDVSFYNDADSATAFAIVVAEFGSLRATMGF